MIFKHILHYAPSSLIPAIVSFAIIYIFTRLLSPTDYGIYALVFNIAFLCQSVLGRWLRIGATRFYDRAEMDGQLPNLAKTLYFGYALGAALFAGVYCAILQWTPVSGHLLPALWLALPFILLRALVTVNLGIHRGAGRINRYNLLECGQTLTGLLFSVAFVVGFGMKEEGIILGLAAGSLLAALADIRLVVRAFASKLDWTILKRIALFGFPLTVSMFLNLVMASSDRLLVEYFLGSAAVGIYSASYGIMSQPMNLIFLAVSMPGMPLAVRALERQGREAGEAQMQRNGEAVFALAIPACIGLIVVSDHLSVLVGGAFRNDVAAIMPWIAVAGLLAGLQVHYFDHAFVLGKRPSLLVKSIGIAAAANVLLNILLLPRFGLMGAVYATMISYIIAIGTSIYYGRSLFKVPIPYKAASRAVLASIPMLIVLLALDLPVTIAGLLGTVSIGAICYAIAAVIFNVCDVRRKLCWRYFRKGTA